MRNHIVSVLNKTIGDRKKLGCIEITHIVEPTAEERDGLVLAAFVLHRKD